MSRLKPPEQPVGARDQCSSVGASSVCTDRDRWAERLLARFGRPPDSPEEWAEVESRFAELCTLDRRRKTGQFFTPPPVASLMAEWVLGCGPRTVLDPAVGLGIFPWTLLRRMPGLDITGIDIDPGMVAVSRSLTPGIRTVCADFLALRDSAKYDALICNPPYIRHHTAKLPEQLYERYSAVVGERLSRLTNIYALFMVEITRRLAPGGRAAVITPAEYLNADFGVAIKRYLMDRGFLFGLVIFDHATLVFGNALTTAAIALLEAPEPTRGREVRIYRVSGIADCRLETAVCSLQSAPNPQAKWQSLGLVTRDGRAETRRLCSLLSRDRYGCE